MNSQNFQIKEKHFFCISYHCIHMGIGHNLYNNNQAFKRLVKIQILSKNPNH